MDIPEFNILWLFIKYFSCFLNLFPFRYIEIFRSSLAELKRSVSGNGRMAPYDLKDRGSNRGGGNNDFGGNNRNRKYIHIIHKTWIIY